MRHNRRTVRLGRNFSERRAMLENMVSSLLSHQEIQTTLQKAKEARRLADRVISLGKRDSLAARRQVFSYLQDHQLTSKVFKEVAPRFKNRNGGYTRILHLSRRKGDGAQMVLLELTEKEIKAKDTKAKSKKDAKGAHAGHDHKHGKHETHEGAEPKVEKEQSFPKHAEKKDKPKPKTGFFKNLGKFFKNKGGG